MSKSLKSYGMNGYHIYNAVTGSVAQWIAHWTSSWPCVVIMQYSQYNVEKVWKNSPQM